MVHSLKRTALAAVALIALVPGWAIAQTGPIDRHALVARHNPRLEAIDPAAPLMVGNGDLGFTVDITGLQTFPEQYSPLAPLLTEAQWAWHSFANPKGYTYADGTTPVDVRGTKQPYAYMKDWTEAQQRPALNWLRENPHRFSLGRVGLDLRDKTGKPARFADLAQTEQSLDLWTGMLTSRFVYDGQAVTVKTRIHPDLDMILVDVDSPLVAQGRLAVSVKFPGVSAKLNPDPSDWNADAKHVTTRLGQGRRSLSLQRHIGDTGYFVALQAGQDVGFVAEGPHAYRIVPAKGAKTLSVEVAYAPDKIPALPLQAKADQAVAQHWKAYWSKGGVVDFTGSTDPRAAELERRVVLSQYLMALNGAGEVPPQEEGLFSNSWNGKFHLEMHPWHAAHFATWGRPELLERSLPWYQGHLKDAQARAASHGLKGAWWPKMVGPDGVDSPSKVSPFIMWQQPHPIFMSELVWRDKPTRATLAKYGELVEQTADLLASFPHKDPVSGRYRIGPPIIPVQENFDPLTTFDPAFELSYFRWGITTAQAWREREGKPRRADWDAVLKDLSPLPQRDGLYLPAASAPDFWRVASSPVCKGHAVEAICANRDHPSFLMPLGYLPGKDVDRETMRRTLRAVETDWDLRQTWGWDYPMIAMTAARLGEPEKAVDWLFFDAKNNQFGSSGMTPRIHLDAHAAQFVPKAAGAGGGEGASPDGPGYSRAAETYFPSNGALLIAVGLMAGGWDGSTGSAPGFPKSGWVVRSEGLKPMP
ncbi:hypothetical protein BH10PSE4_BH10PSE4_09430 [soil metagenome]